MSTCSRWAASSRPYAQARCSLARLFACLPVGQVADAGSAGVIRALTEGRRSAVDEPAVDQPRLTSHVIRIWPGQLRHKGGHVLRGLCSAERDAVDELLVRLPAGAPVSCENRSSIVTHMSVPTTPGR